MLNLLYLDYILLNASITLNSFAANEKSQVNNIFKKIQFVSN